MVPTLIAFNKSSTSGSQQNEQYETTTICIRIGEQIYSKEQPYNSSMNEIDNLLSELCELILKSKKGLDFTDRKRFRIVCKELKKAGYTISL